MQENRPKFIKTVDDPYFERNVVYINSIEKHREVVVLFLRRNYHLMKEPNPLDLAPPMIEIDHARKELNFPVGHPIEGDLYATSEIDSSRYVPISNFHRDMYQSKLSFFMKFCSDLGVKNCRMSEVRQNGKKLNFNVEYEQNLPNAKSAIGSTNKLDSNSLLNSNGVFSFPKPNHKLEKTESKWLVTEPTWKTMQEIRINRDISSYEVEFNMDNDFGINSNTLVKFGKNKFKIGGEFKELSKLSYTYKIEFWPKSN